MIRTSRLWSADMSNSSDSANQTNPITFTPSGPPETTLHPVDAAVLAVLDAAVTTSDDARPAIAAFVADHPSVLEGWAALGDVGRDTIERYAAYRVGYHRGLDQLRKSGWRGSGYVRWSQPQNLGFLRCLEGLGAMAAKIGETDEAERCTLFLQQLDPTRQK